MFLASVSILPPNALQVPTAHDMTGFLAADRLVSAQATPPQLTVLHLATSI